MGTPNLKSSGVVDVSFGENVTLRDQPQNALQANESIEFSDSATISAPSARVRFRRSPGGRRLGR